MHMYSMCYKMFYHNNAMLSLLSSLVNKTVAQNSSEAGNTTLRNNTSGQNSTVQAQNVTLVNNTFENITLANNTTGQNSSIEAHNVTVTNKTGDTAVNATAKKCFKTKILGRKAYVKMFIIEYSDNGILWKEYYEGGEVKVFVLIRKVNLILKSNMKSDFALPNFNTVTFGAHT